MSDILHREKYFLLKERKTGRRLKNNKSLNCPLCFSREWCWDASLFQAIDPEYQSSIVALLFSWKSSIFFSLSPSSSFSLHFNQHYEMCCNFAFEKDLCLCACTDAIWLTVSSWFLFKNKCLFYIHIHHCSNVRGKSLMLTKAALIWSKLL